MVKCKFEHDRDCCNCGSPQYMCKCKPKTWGSVVPMTNADRIRAMSDEELAEYLAGIASGPLLRLAEQFGVPLTSEKNEKYIAELKTEYLKRLQSPENGGLTWNG